MSIKIEISGDVRKILESSNVTQEQVGLIKVACSADPSIMSHELWHPWFTRNLRAIQAFNDTFLAQQDAARAKNAGQQQTQESQSSAMFRLLNEALDDERAMSATDHEEWFYDWRDRVHTLIRTIEGKTASSQGE